MPVPMRRACLEVEVLTSSSLLGIFIVWLTVCETLSAGTPHMRVHITYPHRRSTRNRS
ncbi:hypothetical protein PLICRDRAFT_449828 [Plicaturopsis crispa FD-325 SS-3]|uniref:Uncharacterized protein n=1 Tax=Plicaturopsis crispa FD-325 SS-3 TaxID=944288 RepID=A0A0C9T3I9_PLICR|nr:hypothetical protein PLICRDRAFT_449828 [Plicaturopsis crispa FD-325 SS-3]